MVFKTATSARYRANGIRPGANVFGLAALLAALLLLTGCPSTGGVRDSSSELSTALRYQKQGRHAEAAALFQRLANRERGDARDALLLDTTRAWLEAGKLTRALNALDNVAGTVPADDKAVAMLRGYQTLRDGQPDQALQHLERIRPQLPARYLGLWYDLRGRAFFQSGNVARGVASLVERELWLNDGDAIQSNRDVIWRALQAVGEKGAEFETPIGTDTITAGWLALAQANATGALNPLGRLGALRDWQETHPGHPASFVVERLSDGVPLSFDFPDTVAVLLPLSGRFAGTAAAIRDGLMAAYLADDSRITRPALRFYDTGAEEVTSALNRAGSDGARFVIGPLLKTEVDAVALAPAALPILALNTTTDAVTGAPSLFQFSLAPEHEAATVAERAVAEGLTRAVALVPNSAWGERLLNAFNNRLTALGGEVVSYQTYEAGDSDFAIPITTLLNLNQSRERWRQVTAATGANLEFEPRRRRDAQFVFVATNAQQSRLIRPAFQYHFAEDLPIFATSAAFENDVEANGRDLDGLVFADMPWVVSQNAESIQVTDAFRRHWPSRVQRRSRLYAMGYDAYRLIPQLLVRDEWVEPWPGVTGRLTLSSTNTINRDLDVAVVRGGRAERLEPIVPPGYFDSLDFFETGQSENNAFGDPAAEPGRSSDVNPVGNSGFTFPRKEPEDDRSDSDGDEQGERSE